MLYVVLESVILYSRQWQQQQQQGLGLVTNRSEAAAVANNKLNLNDDLVVICRVHRSSSAVVVDRETFVVSGWLAQAAVAVAVRKKVTVVNNVY